MTPEEFDEKMFQPGWVVFESVVKPDMIDWMRTDLEVAYSVCRSVQIKNGIEEDTKGTTHHLPTIAESFLEFLGENPVHDYLERWLGGKYVLQSFGGNMNYPGEESYASNIHRDIRRPQLEHLVVNTLVMLDDFTPWSGATWLLPRSFGDRKPEEDLFRERAKQVIAPEGSILVFDSNVWHAAGVNRSRKPRRSVTPMFCRPNVKPGFDYCRAIDMRCLSETQKQVLGYYARIPASLEEWYRKPEERCYRSDQG